MTFKYNEVYIVQTIEVYAPSSNYIYNVKEAVQSVTKRGPAQHNGTRVKYIAEVAGEKKNFLEKTE